MFLSKIIYLIHLLKDIFIKHERGELLDKPQLSIDDIYPINTTRYNITSCRPQNYIVAQLAAGSIQKNRRPQQINIKKNVSLLGQTVDTLLLHILKFK